MNGQDIHCPSCGDLVLENVSHGEMRDKSAGRACPNYCGWIAPEVDGEDMIVRVGIYSY